MEAIMVRFRSGLSGPEGQAVKDRRKAACQKIPGLLQAYYLEVHQDEEELGAFFLFDGAESLEAFLATDVVQRTPEEMMVQGELDRSRFEVTDTLHELA